MSKPVASVITTMDQDTYVDVRIPILKMKDLTLDTDVTTVSETLHARGVALAAARPIIEQRIDELVAELNAAIKTGIESETNFTFVG